VNFYSISPDGRTLAFAAAPAAARSRAAPHRRGQRPATGEPLPANFGVARWTADGRAFSVNRLQPSRAQARQYRRAARLAAARERHVAQAHLLLGPGMRSVDVKPSEAPQVLFTADGRWMIGLLEDGVRTKRACCSRPRRYRLR